MSDPVFVDTGHLIGLLNSDDDHHGAALRWAVWVEERRTPLVVSTAVLLELGNTFHRPRSWPRAAELIDSLRTDPRVTVVVIDFVIATVVVIVVVISSLPSLSS